MPLGSGSNLISKILSPALRLWLRSQVEQAEGLEIAIQGHDRQILKGYVPGVSLRTEQAIYQGLRLGQVLLKGENIRVNIGQVIKGKPLQLLEPIRVSGEVRLAASDLQASLASEILANALTDLLIILLDGQGQDNPSAYLAHYQLQWQAIALDHQSFSLQGCFQALDPTAIPLKLTANLNLADAKTLQLQQIQLQGLPNLELPDIPDLTVDLGDDVELESLALTADELSCLGHLLIRP